VCFDSEGLFYADRRSEAAGQKFSRDQMVTVLLNLEDGTSNSNTVSLFVDGKRACKPLLLPPELKGKALYPHVCFRNVSLQVHFGPQPLAPLPFQCRSLQSAAAADCVVRKADAVQDGKFEVLFPVAIPDEGTFDWLDGFLEDNPDYTELSDRAIMDWAVKSGMTNTVSSGSSGSKDKPKPSFGVKELDELLVRKLLYTVAPVTPRNYVVMEVKSNLVPGDRKDMLKRFGASYFKPVAQVNMGEPDAMFKSRVRTNLLRDKLEQATLEAKIKNGIKEPGEDIKDEIKEELDVDKDEKIGLTVELTEEEKKAWFRPAKTSDVHSSIVDASIHEFSLPDATEGFSEIRWGWQDEESCRAHLKDWLKTRKLKVPVDNIQSSEQFVYMLTDWCTKLKDWQAKQSAFKQQEQAMNELSTEAEPKQDGDKDAADASMEPKDFEHHVMAPEVENVMAVTDITDTGGGRPLFSNSRTRIGLCCPFASSCSSWSHRLRRT
jgi:hypothetical protein